MSELDGITRDTYHDISLYRPNRVPAAIDLSDNTNLWGIPPAASAIVHDAATSWVTRYPAVYAADVKQAIADYAGVSADMVVTGCGSDDVLDSAVRAFGEPGDRVAYPDPSFHMISLFAKMNGLEPVPIALTDTYDADADAFIAARAKVTYLCSPNNPTGAALSRDRIERVVAETTGVVIIDEAYAEYAGRNCLDLARSSPRVLVSRTLSKAFGLAGLRVGYGIGHPELVVEVEKSRGPYKVNGLAQRAAVAALTDDRAWVDAHVRESIENRERLVAVLRGMGMATLPSDANFILVPVEDAAAIDRRMRELGVAVRPFIALPRIGDALRISMGPWTMLEECARVLRAVLDERRATAPTGAGAS